MTCRLKLRMKDGQFRAHDAIDIAREVIAEAMHNRWGVVLYVYQNLEVDILPAPQHLGSMRGLQSDLSIVGVYNSEANEKDIVADINATPRGEERL